ncbi:hypothetical protein FACS1894156_0630 [Bacteroidia bacterium]|nr:hypothetical protein FACS1894156_0630 [Bacteroidia bacterium]
MEKNKLTPAIKNDEQYDATLTHIDELMCIVNNDTPIDNPNIQELELLSQLIVEYDQVHYLAQAPTEK